MEEQCLVMCGDWICGQGSKWDFVVDKRQMARLVPVSGGSSLNELQSSVLREFGKEEKVWGAVLSYWPPSSLELVTGARTPPVQLTSDGAIKYFLQHFRVGGPMNLFVRFEQKLTACEDLNSVDDSGMGFVTPVGFAQKSSFKRASGVSNGGYVSTGASKAKAADFVDVEFMSEIDRVEAEINRRKREERSGGVNPAVKRKQKEVATGGVGQFDEGEALSGSSGGEDATPVTDVDELEVRPRGYDQDFWKPLLNSDYKGSNAVNVIYNEDEIVAGLTRGSGGRRFTCTASDAFEHVVEVGGSSSGVKLRKDVDFRHQNPWLKGVDARVSVDRPRKVSTRKLDEVDDEEFDIPPMFDDTSYAAPEIPDMDLDERDGRIYVGKVFGNKEDCQISLAIYAIKNQFHFKQTRTKVDSFVVECPDEHCDWRVTAHEIRGCGYYEIRKAQLDHRCPIDSRQGYKSKATSKVIAAVYKSKFGEPGKGPVPAELQRLVLEDLRVTASYMKCYRAKEKATIGALGSDEDSYLKLPEYLHMLKLANPGTVADLETEIDEDGDERFLYMFLAFGASIDGFKKLRRVLVIDGTHLGGKYKGVLLTASGQDANFQIFPLAFAVVDSEDTDAWTWFLQKVERLLADSPSLSIISDRAQSIYAAVKRVYPSAQHGACIVHLARNVNSRYSSKNLAKLVTETATAYRMSDYRELYSKVRATNSACGVYLGKIGVAHWSRANFVGDRYNIMTSNIAEQLNKALVEGRTSPIMELVIFIQRMMTRWFSARRKKAEKHRGSVSVEVDKEMTQNMATMRGSKVNSVSNWTCEIVGKFGKKDRVMLAEKRCDCKYFDKVQIPCGHAMIAADSLGVTYETLVGHWYKTTTWRETYAGIISPEGNPRDVDIPDEVAKKVLMPPLTSRPGGRPRKNRIPSTGEFQVTKKTKLVQNRCGRCRKVGHNRTRCTEPI